MKITCIETNGTIRTREYHANGYSDTSRPAELTVCTMCKGTGQLVDKEDWTGSTYDCVCRYEAEDDINSDDIYQQEKIEGVMWGTSHDPRPYSNWEVSR